MPAIYISPGFFILSMLKKKRKSLIIFLVESFFLSTISLILITLLFTIIGINLEPMIFSFLGLIFSLGNLIIEKLTKNFNNFENKQENMIVLLSFVIFIVELMIFYYIPRFFLIDETVYINYSQNFISDQILLILTVPTSINSLLNSIFYSRLGWILLLSSFKSSTLILNTNLYIFNLYFLTMISLLSTCFIKTRKIKTFLPILIFSNPMLLYFSLLGLPEVALSFYCLLSIYFFTNSFSFKDKELFLDYSKIFLSFIALGISLLIKITSSVLLIAYFLIFLLVYIFYRKSGDKSMSFFNKTFKIFVIILILYEVFIDFPYIFFKFYLINNELSLIFSRFIGISFLQQLIFLFSNIKPLNYQIDAIYSIMIPEIFSVIIISSILIFPLLIIKSHQRREHFQKITFFLIFIFSFVFFLFLNFSNPVSNILKSSPFLYPIYIIITIYVFEILLEEKYKNFPLYPYYILFTVIFLICNLYISAQFGGIFFYWMGRKYTFIFLLFQCFILVLLYLVFFISIKLDQFIQFKIFFKRIKLNNFSLSFLKKNKSTMHLLILLSFIGFNNICFSYYIFGNSEILGDDRGINNSFYNELEKYSASNSFIFGNNYVYLRPYIEDDLKNINYLPLPPTEEEFKLLGNLPFNNTYFYITNDTLSTSGELSNNYIKPNIILDLIPLQKKNHSNLLNYNLSLPLVHYKFDKIENSELKDISGNNNNGSIYNLTINNGGTKYGFFNGSAYVTLYNNLNSTFNEEISISFMGNITRNEFNKILSKGTCNEVVKGSFEINLWDYDLSFEIREVGVLSMDMEKYFDSWHHFLFNYDGNKMQIFVDGELIALREARGIILDTNYPLEIGRDSALNNGYFEGFLYDFQISNYSISSDTLIEFYYSSIAIKDHIYELNENAIVKFYKIENNNNYSGNSLASEINSVNYIKDINDTLKLTINLQSNSQNEIYCLISTKFFTRVLNFNIDNGENELTYKLDKNTDEIRVWQQLTHFRLIIVENQEVIYDQYLTLYDNDILIFSTFIFFLLIFLISIISFSDFFKRFLKN